MTIPVRPAEPAPPCVGAARMHDLRRNGGRGSREDGRRYDGRCAVIPVETGQHRIDQDDLDDPDYGERRYVVGERNAPNRSWPPADEPWWHITYADGHESSAPDCWLRRDPIETEGDGGTPTTETKGQP